MAFRRLLLLLLFFSSILFGCSNNARAEINSKWGEEQFQNGLQTINAATEPPKKAATATQIPMTSTPTLAPTMAVPKAMTPSILSTPYANKHIPEEAPVKACLLRGGKMVVSTLSTNLIPLPLDYRVFLPPCYEQNYKQRYPVLILIHGQSYNDDQWDRLGVDETINRLVLSGELPPFIVLMPRDRYGGDATENNFARVVVEQLLPLIDETYRTKPDRQFRAVGGLSRGAGWAVHIGMTYWQDFSRIGAHSPAIFYNDAQKMRTMLDNIPKDQIPLVFVDIGQRDRPEILDSAYWFANLLNEKGVAHEWYLFAGFHNEEYWSLHVEQYLRWYAQSWVN